MLRWFLIILFQSGLYAFAQTTWYVAVSGSDTNSGQTASEAFATTNHAIDVATCGDSILILKGPYEEKISAYRICPADNRIVIHGDPQERPVITGDRNATNKYAIGVTGQGFVFRHLALTSPFPNECDPSNMVVVGRGDHFLFDDIWVYGSGYDGIKTVHNCEENDFPTGWAILNSKVFDNGLGCPASIVNGDGIDFTSCHDCEIRSTEIYNNKGHQLQVKLQAKNLLISDCHIEGNNMIQVGLRGNSPQCNPETFNAENVTFRRNTIRATGDTSLFVFKLADVKNLTIENNTIVKDEVNTDVGFICFGGCGSGESWEYTPQAPTVIRNNIFYSKATKPFFAGPDTTFFDPFAVLESQVSADYNLFYDDQGDINQPPDQGDHSLVAPPDFCNYPTSYGLNSNSQCIDAGDPSTTDPDGSRADIGAVYYAGNCEKTVLSIPNKNPFIYPNPASDHFYFKGSIDFPAKVRIYEINGRLVHTSTLNVLKPDLEISHIRPGIYLINLDNRFLGRLIIR